MNISEPVGVADKGCLGTEGAIIILCRQGKAQTTAGETPRQVCPRYGLSTFLDLLGRAASLA